MTAAKGIPVHVEITARGARMIDRQRTEQTADTLRAMIAEREAERIDLIARTGPKVLNGHSDGRRVKYVRAETAEATLRAVLAMLESV